MTNPEYSPDSSHKDEEQLLLHSIHEEGTMELIERDSNYVTAQDALYRQARDILNGGGGSSLSEAEEIAYAMLVKSSDLFIEVLSVIEKSSDDHHGIPNIAANYLSHEASAWKRIIESATEEPYDDAPMSIDDFEEDILEYAEYLPEELELDIIREMHMQLNESAIDDIIQVADLNKAAMRQQIYGTGMNIIDRLKESSVINRVSSALSAIVMRLLGRNPY